MSEKLVLSYNPEIIRVIKGINGKKVVEKKTTTTEYLQIIAAREHLFEKEIRIGRRKIKVMPAKVLAWNKDKNVITLSFCEGRNLECIMKSSLNDSHGEIIRLLRNLFYELKRTGFMWGDLAPRNIIYNESRNVFYLVDFERSLSLSETPVVDSVFARYLRGYAMEEFACFLFKEEQGQLFSGFISEDIDYEVALEKVQSRRKMSLLSAIFGSKNSYSVREIQIVELIMADIATPLKTAKGTIYPMFAIEEAARLGGVGAYTSIALQLKEEKDERKIEIIK